MKCLFMMVPLALGAAACADELDHGYDDGSETPDAGDTTPSRVTNTENADGTTTTRVDASAEAVWVYLDLEAKEEVEATSTSWDLAFQRTKIMVDGGVSGSGNVAVAILDGVAFDGMAAAPAGGYVTDEADGDDMNTDPDLAFLRDMGWYSYNPMTHVITPRERVYVVRTVEGAYVKVQLTDYYDQAGTSGFPTFRWASINPPAP
jgi:hypothetical protein